MCQNKYFYSYERISWVVNLEENVTSMFLYGKFNTDVVTWVLRWKESFNRFDKLPVCVRSFDDVEGNSNRHHESVQKPSNSFSYFIGVEHSIYSCLFIHKIRYRIFTMMYLTPCSNDVVRIICKIKNAPTPLSSNSIFLISSFNK